MPADVETQLRTLGRQLDREVTHVDVDEVIGATTLLELETTAPPEPKGERHRTRSIVAAALAAAAAAVTVIVLLQTDDRPDDDRVPSDTVPAVELLAPPADVADLVVTEAAHGRTAPGIIRAAVQTVSGEIIGMTVDGPNIGGGMGGNKMIAGRHIGVSKAFEGRELVDFWTYSDSGDCFVVKVTVSDGLEVGSPFTTTPEDIETFFWRLQIRHDFGSSDDGGTVTLELRPGWESLGVARETDRYVLRFSANVDGKDAEFELDQRPAIGVGVFLADPGRTNPQPTTLDDQPAWVMTGSDGWTTLVFDDAGTAVSLRARGLDEDALTDFAATLVRRPWKETAALLAPSNPTRTPVEEKLAGHRLPLPAGCDVTLEVVADSRRAQGMPHADPLFPPAGPLALGRHEWPWRRMMPTPIYAFTISAPRWRSGGDQDVPGGGGWIEKGTPGTPDGAIITFGRLDRVYADPCGHTLSNPQTSPQTSSSDLADAVAAIPGIELISGPTTTLRGEHQVGFRIPDGIQCDPRQFYLWQAGGRPRAARELRSTISVSIIDGPSWGGQPLFVAAETYGDATAQLQREVQQIVDSFTPTGGGMG